MASASPTRNSSATSTSGSMASASASASASGSQSEVGAVAEPEQSSNAGDSCTWYAGGSCLRPRSCADCLNVLLSSDSCAINPDGACVGSSEYKAYVDAPAYYIPSHKYYPSSAYSYCASGDATCAACVASWRGRSSASVSTSDVCTGQGGCICVAACEVTDRIATIRSEQKCSGGSSSDSDASLSPTERFLVALAVGASVGFFVYVMVWVLRRYVLITRRRELARRSAHREPRTGPQLNLNGWKALQQKLVETERARLSREPAAAPRESEADPALPSQAAATPAGPATPLAGESAQAFVAQDEEAPGIGTPVMGAPVMGTMLAAVGGPAVIVERGDAYRPPSPSRMNARQA